METDLIFDLGMHQGEDTSFYLHKGFRVVGVEANPDLCAHCARRFPREVASGQLTIVNEAIAEQPGEITFYRNDRTIWGTVDPEWAARNRRLGTKTDELTVTATTMKDLLARHGVPYYAKIDIEGLDMVALKGFGDAAEAPKYVSIESDKVSFRALREEFAVLTSLGYDSFKLVSQMDVDTQVLPRPPLEGKFTKRKFAIGSSGAFGEETPGEWLSAEEAIEAYRPVFLQYALTGDDPYLRSERARRFLKRFRRFRDNWYDTHARRSDA